MKRKAMKIVPVVTLCILALGLMLYPNIGNHVNKKHASEAHIAFKEAIAQTSDSDLMEAKALAIAYNEIIALGNSKEAYAQAARLEATVDYEAQLNIGSNGIMGYVEVPKICINLPIYHSANNNSQNPGAEHLLGSSLPVGGESTHAVLLGYNDPAAQKKFSGLEQLIVGDVFYLHVLGETLAYQIDSIKTVLPDVSNYLGVTSGEDYCTLVTWAPYGVNTHQLLVRGTRIPYEEAKAIATKLVLE